MSLIVVVSILAFSLQVFYYCAFAVATLRKDGRILDLAWALAPLFTFALAVFFRGVQPSSLLVADGLFGLGALHALFLYWAYSEVSHKKVLYKKGSSLLVIYLQHFFTRALLQLPLVLPAMLLGLFFSGSISLLTGFGFLIWGVGTLVMVVADWQQLLFERQGRSGVLQKGIWEFSRHPSIFGGCLVWLGVLLVVVGLPEVGPWVFLSPLAQGIFGFWKMRAPITAYGLAKSSTQYTVYRKRVSPFLLLPPRDRI